LLQERCTNGLKALAKLAVTTQLLTDTQAGRRIRVLCKHSSSDISSAAADVVTSWKNVVRREIADAGAATKPAQASQDAETTATAPNSQQEGRHNAEEGRETAASKDVPPPLTETQVGTSRRPSIGGLYDSSTPISTSQAESVPLSVSQNAPPLQLKEIPATGDNVRNKVRSNLANALAKAFAEGPIEGKDPVDAAVAVEQALFEANRGVTASYKAKFRQLHFNLKDEKNPDLRRRVLEGGLDPETLLTLPPEELASDAKREENERIRKDKLFHAAPAAATQMVSDGMFQCHKCR
jgi:transcription elongation factor S-II